MIRITDGQNLGSVTRWPNERPMWCASGRWACGVRNFNCPWYIFYPLVSLNYTSKKREGWAVRVKYVALGRWRAYTFGMKVRKAKVTDVFAIHALINRYAEEDKMLFRSMADVYENLQIFNVAVESDGQVVGCCAMQVVWADLGELKSLAVDPGFMGKGAGRMLVEGALEQASQLELPKVFTLTLEPEFFEKFGFELVSKDLLPMKVWSDCARCSKQDNCDEIAMILEI